MGLWSQERHRSVRLSWCLTGAKVGQAEMANLQGFFQVVFVPPFKHSCEIWKTRSTDNLCLPFAVYLCPKTFKPFMMYNLSGVQCQQICCVHISTTLLHLIHPAAGPGTMFSRALSSIRFSSSPAPLPKKRLHTNTFADGRYHHLLASNEQVNRCIFIKNCSVWCIHVKNYENQTLDWLLWFDCNSAVQGAIIKSQLIHVNILLDCRIEIFVHVC